MFKEEVVNSQFAPASTLLAPNFSSKFKRVLVTGGAGFIGSAFIRKSLRRSLYEKIINLDVLTYAGNIDHLEEIFHDPRHFFVQGNICEEKLVEQLCRDHRIEAIVHFAAETHVDKSISSPSSFFETNVRGTLSLLEVVRRHPSIHFHHVSTDEVYGSLEEGGCFSEISPYRPNSPYAASKAASDHFVRSYTKTYGLSTTLSHCSNNFGPHQNDEKLLPTIIRCCTEKRPIPIYGAGTNVRDWLFIDDHIEALWLILEHGKRGEVYDIGGGIEKKNIELVYDVIHCFGEEDLHRLISFVADRPAHDFRYAIDHAKIARALGWKPRHSFSEALKQTVRWYKEKYENNLCNSCASQI